MCSQYLAHGAALTFCVKQKSAYDMRISDWSSDVCSSDLHKRHFLFYCINAMDLPIWLHDCQHNTWQACAGTHVDNSIFRYCVFIQYFTYGLYNRQTVDKMLYKHLLWIA